MISGDTEGEVTFTDALAICFFANSALVGSLISDKYLGLDAACDLAENASLDRLVRGLPWGLAVLGIPFIFDW